MTTSLQLHPQGVGPSAEAFNHMVSLQVDGGFGPSTEAFNHMVSFQSIDDYLIGASLIMHLDAARITGISNGGSVAIWNNQADLSNSPDQASGTARPTYRTSDFNGLPCVRFDGTNDCLVTGAAWTSGKVSGDPNFTVFVVYQKQNVAKGHILGFGAGSPLNGFGIYDDNSTPQWAYSANPFNINTCANATPFVRSYRKKAGAINTQSQSKLNGVTDSTGAGDSTNTPSVSVGEFHVGKWFTNFGQVDIAELIIANTAMSDEAITSITSALMTKWGV